MLDGLADPGVEVWEGLRRLGVCEECGSGSGGGGRGGWGVF